MIDFFEESVKAQRTGDDAVLSEILWTNVEQGWISVFHFEDSVYFEENILDNTIGREFFLNKKEVKQESKDFVDTVRYSLGPLWDFDLLEFRGRDLGEKFTHSINSVPKVVFSKDLKGLVVVFDIPVLLLIHILILNL